MSFEQDCLELKVDVGVLKQQVLTLTQLCNKMDAVIEKLSDNQNKMNEDIYEDMDKKKSETVNDIKELHSRITTVDRNLSDKIELTERRIMEEIRDLRKHITEHNAKEDGELKKILEWKWMAAGGIIVIAWLVSNINLSVIGKLFG
jgi:division protein CdvB (Snf7/Vps24/ESCRT-III family)